MKYTIWSIDDSRSAYISKIEQAVDFDPIYIKCVDGRNEEIRLNEIKSLDLELLTGYDLQPGEIGVWLTFVNTLKTVVSLGENVVTFEDDALLHGNFMSEFNNRFRQVPHSFDFFTLFIPRDHDHWFSYEPILDNQGLILNGTHSQRGVDFNRVNDLIYRPWHRYGGVSMVWSPKGAQKALDLIYSEPYKQWDEFIYAQARLNNLEGYTSNPTLSDLVYISGNEISLTHQ